MITSSTSTLYRCASSFKALFKSKADYTTKWRYGSTYRYNFSTFSQLAGLTGVPSWRTSKYNWGCFCTGRVPRVVPFWTVSPTLYGVCARLPYTVCTWLGCSTITKLPYLRNGPAKMILPSSRLVTWAAGACFWCPEY